MPDRLQPQHKSLRVNGLNIHYLEWGAANAPPVVCVHGYTSSADAFNAVARHFQHRLRFIAPDVRGHGLSDWSPDGAYGYLDQMSDIAELVNRLELEKFALIGTSMGGVIAMAYAGAHARRLKSLVINDVGPDIEQGSTRITNTVGARPASFASLDEAIAYRASASPITAARLAEDQRELALGVLKETADGRWVWKMDPAYIQQRVKFGAPQRPDLWPALRALPCPTQLIWGTTSDVLGETQARRMVETLPHAELVEVPGIGHAPTLVEPECLKALDQLL
jgi:pimeloyl-ACP methyl ester carboxylesterase